MNKRSIHNLLSKVFSCWLLICIIFCAANIFAQENIGYEDKGKRDPFIALVTPDGQLLNLEPTGSGSKIFLGGIIYDKHGRSYAIINDEVVGIGDYVLGYAVFKIDQDKVILLKDNMPVEYKLQKEEP